MIVLHTYEKGKVAKTFTADKFSLMMGTIEDALALFEKATEADDNAAIATIIVKNRDVLYNIILDIFPEMTREDIRNVRSEELIPFFLQILDYFKETLIAKN